MATISKKRGRKPKNITNQNKNSTSLKVEIDNNNQTTTKKRGRPRKNDENLVITEKLPTCLKNKKVPPINIKITIK